MEKISLGPNDAPSDVSEECRDERNRERLRRGKKEKGYAQLSRASSEEELVLSKSAKPKKGGKVFGKLQGRQKEKDKRRVQQVSPSPTLKKKDSKEKEKYQNRARKIHDFPGRKPVFGVPLEVAEKNNRSHDGVPIPAVLRQSLDFVTETGLTTEGIYRISPPKTQLDELRLAADSGKNFRFLDAHCATGFIKLFLRDLPEHILTTELEAQFEKAAAECPCRTEFCSCLTGDRLKALLTKLPKWNYHLLAYLFQHMQEIIRNEEHNKMGLANIGLVMQPTLSMSQRLLAIFLQNTSIQQKQATSLFSDVEKTKYVPPLRAAPDKLAQSLPVTRNEIEVELQKQQSLLTELHEEVGALTSQGLNNASKEQELWEVQMVATQLKRRLKTIRQTEDKESPMKEDGGNSPEEDHGPCIEMFEEKQLLAVQMELKERILLEKRAIRELEDQILEAKRRTSTLGSQESANFEDEMTEEEYKSRYSELKNRRDFLLSEIVQERRRCARLRAEIELVTIQKQQHLNNKLPIDVSHL